MAEKVKQVRRPRTPSAMPRKTPRRSSAAKTARRRIEAYEAEARTSLDPPATAPKRRRAKTSASVPAAEALRPDRTVSLRPDGAEGIQTGDELLRQELMQ